MKYKINRLVSSLIVAIWMLLICVALGCLGAIIVYGIAALLIYSTWIGISAVMFVTLIFFTYIIYVMK